MADELLRRDARSSPGHAQHADPRRGRRSRHPGDHGSGIGRAQGRKIEVAFCSQLLCIVPYEVARANGHFAKHGLDAELVYTRGGNAAMQALVGGAVEYGATSLGVALQAYAHGAEIRRFATTGRLPLFAVATAPGKADQIREIKDLADRTV